MVLDPPGARVTRQGRTIYVKGPAPSVAEELEDLGVVVRMLGEEPGVLIAEFSAFDQHWDRARGFSWYRGLARTPPIGVIFAGCVNEVFRMGLSSLSAGGPYPIYFSDGMAEATRLASRIEAEWCRTRGCG